MIKKIKNLVLLDKRGSLLKNYSALKKKFTIKESIFSYNKPDVIRGMYMQTGKFCETKLITMIYGSLTWVAVDLRKKSKTFMKVYKIKLTKNDSIFIPKGYAHGSISHKETLLHIMTDNVYNDKKAVKIKYNDKSLKIKWPIKKKMIISNDHLSYKDFKSYKILR